MKTKSTEDYLKNIFWLVRLDEKVTTKALAQRMGISSGSVTDMLKKLKANGYLDYTPYHGVGLTKKGEKVALQVIRRHRLLEAFLVKALGFRWDAVHEEAERLEHVISDEMEERIDRYLGHPKYDPHGDPIPTHEGVLEEPDHFRLSELSVGESGVIMQVSDSQHLLQYMQRLDLNLNSKLQVKSKETFDHSMSLRINGKKEQVLSKDVTNNIFVKKVK